MYNKDKYRRFSDSKEESIQREVFIRELNYQIDIPVIKSVFIERAFRWGTSYRMTHLLTPADTFSIENELDKPYNVGIECIYQYNGYKVERHDYDIYVSDLYLKDTIKINIFLTDTVALRTTRKNYNRGKYVLKIW